jgi:DnaK suppressor protein
MRKQRALCARQPGVQHGGTMPIKKKQKPGSALMAASKKKHVLTKGPRPSSKLKTVVSKKPKAKGREVVIKPPPKTLSKEMLEISSRLVAMLKQTRRDIAQEVRGASDRDLAHINDSSDMAADAAEGDLALRIAESETVEASEIERAIEKIDNGTYGHCEVCNQAIGADRMRFLPYVTLCIRCQALTELKCQEDGEELEDLVETPETENDNG